MSARQSAGPVERVEVGGKWKKKRTGFIGRVTWVSESGLTLNLSINYALTQVKLSTLRRDYEPVK